MSFAAKKISHNLSVSSNVDQLHDELIGFDQFGTNTQIQELSVQGCSVPVYINEFWTSKQRAANSLHEVSYRACFKPQLPRFFIARLSRLGDVVYDPFMGKRDDFIGSGASRAPADGL